MMWTVVRSVVPYLSRDFREALLEYEKETQGKKAAKARWLSCVEDLNAYSHGLTFALGYLWVKNIFDVEIIPSVSKASFDISLYLQKSISGHGKSIFQIALLI